MGHRIRFLGLILALAWGGLAQAFIERIYALKEVLDESNFVVVGRLESVDAQKRIAVAVVERALKGTKEFQRVQMNLGIGPDDHARYLLARLRAGQPVILYYKHDGRDIASCVHAGDTWFQLFATDDADRGKVWWRMSHLEVMMGRTFNGPTADLIKLTDDVLARRAAPPKPDPAVPRIDPSKASVGGASLPRETLGGAPLPRETLGGAPLPGIDGLEAVQGWYAENQWARAAAVTIDPAAGRGKVMNVRSNGQADRKLAVTLLQNVDLSKDTQFALDLDNGSARPITVSVAFGSAPGWEMQETPGVAVPAGAKAAPLSFALTQAHFKSQTSKWEHDQPLANGGRVDKIMLLVEGLPERGSVCFDRIRGARGGFFRQLAFPHPGGEIRGVAWADVNGDERLDAILCCGEGNVLLAGTRGSDAPPTGGSFRDVTARLGLRGGSRAASWADYDGDGRPDLLTSNFQLFTNTGAGFRDDSALIGVQGGRNPEGAGWIDFNGDGRPDILITNGEHGIRLFENTGKGPAWFRDVSEKAGLGPRGLGVGNGDFVAFADLDGDGYTDFLYNLGSGVLAHNQGDGTFRLETKSGIELAGGSGYKRGVAFADYDNDGDLDLFVPGTRGRDAPPTVRLYRNNNDGTFTNVIGASGDLAAATDPSFAAAWGDVNHDGCLDLFVCYAKGAGRLFLGDGKGGFREVGGAVGLDRLAPAFGAAFADADGDGDLDLMVNLEGKAVLAFNDMDKAAGHAFLLVKAEAARGLVGAVVRVADEKGRPLGLRELNGAEGPGGQACPVAHFGLPLGPCRVSVCLSDGRVAQKSLAIEPQGARLTLSEKDFQ